MSVKISLIAFPGRSVESYINGNAVSLHQHDAKIFGQLYPLCLVQLAGKGKFIFPGWDPVLALLRSLGQIPQLFPGNFAAIGGKYCPSFHAFFAGVVVCLACSLIRDFGT